MENKKFSISRIDEQKLPSNLEAEQALIGSVLVNNDIIDEVAHLINSSKFRSIFYKTFSEISCSHLY